MFINSPLFTVDSIGGYLSKKDYTIRLMPAQQTPSASCSAREPPQQTAAVKTIKPGSAAAAATAVGIHTNRYLKRIDALWPVSKHPWKRLNATSQDTFKPAAGTTTSKSLNRVAKLLDKVTAAAVAVTTPHSHSPRRGGVIVKSLGE